MAAFLLALVLVPAAAHGQDFPPNITVKSHGPCSAVTVGTGGNVVNNIYCDLGLSGHQFEAIMDAIRRGYDPQANAEVERLSRRLGVTEAALEGFFRLLGEDNVPPEDLDARLRQLAVGHLALRWQLRPSDTDDPGVAQLRGDADAAVGRGDYDTAETLLRLASEQDLAAERELTERIEQRRASRAATTAALAAMAAQRFRYPEAAELYKEAADILPQGALPSRAEYLSLAGLALWKAGRYDEALVLHTRRNVSTTLIHPGSEFKLVSRPSAGIAQGQGRYPAFVPDPAG